MDFHLELLTYTRVLWGVKTESDVADSSNYLSKNNQVTNPWKHGSMEPCNPDRKTSSLHPTRNLMGLWHICWDREFQFYF